MKLTRSYFARFDWNRIIIGAGPFLLLVFYSILATLPDLRLAVAELTGITGLLVILLAVILFLGEKQAPEWPIWLILIIALLIRLPFLMRPPELSDDIYRYLWDGLQLLSGQNPYALAPAEIPAATDSLATIKNAVNHPQLVTIYGPAAQLFFASASLLGGTIVGFKAALILVDLSCCYLLCRLLCRFQIPLWKSVLYAWHPMPVLEIAGSGHIEGVGLFLLLAALLSLAGTSAPAKAAKRANSFWIAGLFSSCSVLVKLFPIVFLPGILLLPTHRKWSGGRWSHHYCRLPLDLHCSDSPILSGNYQWPANPAHLWHDLGVQLVFLQDVTSPPGLFSDRASVRWCLLSAQRRDSLPPVISFSQNLFRSSQTAGNPKDILHDIAALSFFHPHPSSLVRPHPGFTVALCRQPLRTSPELEPVSQLSGTDLLLPARAMAGKRLYPCADLDGALDSLGFTMDLWAEKENESCKLPLTISH